MAEHRPSDAGSGSGLRARAEKDELDRLDGGAIEEALKDAARGSVPPEAELAALNVAIQADLDAEKRPLAWFRSLSTPVRVVFGLAAILAVPLAAVLIAPRADVALHPVFFGAVAATAVLLIAVLGPTSLRGYQRPPMVRGLFGAVVALALAWPLVVAFLPHLSSSHWVSGDTVFHGINCFSTGLVMAAIPLVALRLLDRGEHRSLSRVALAAAGAGLAAVLSLELMCSVITRAHVLGAHATVLFVVFGGYLLLRRYGRGARATS